MGHTEWAGTVYGQLDYVASSGSSTTEASAVSLVSPFPWYLPLVLVCVLFVVLWVVLVFVLCFFSCFASAWGCFDLYPRVLDDRQCRHSSRSRGTLGLERPSSLGDPFGVAKCRNHPV